VLFVAVLLSFFVAVASPLSCVLYQQSLARHPASFKPVTAATPATHVASAKVPVAPTAAASRTAPVTQALQAAPPAESAAPPAATPVNTFAVVGDFGGNGAGESEVASLVASWLPAYIVTTGDNYYSVAGGAGSGRYDLSVGMHYNAWVKDNRPGNAGSLGAAPTNAFFPALGNHDYFGSPPSADTYLSYFTLPGDGFRNTSGNERYYDYVEGPIHFFALNSNTEEPDGVTATSKQARWLKRELAASTSRWNIVYDHHPPYSSDTNHGSVTYMRWPFAKWGADAVFSGHSHDYERIERDRITYVVDGLGGVSRYAFGPPVAGSAIRYDATMGAMKATVTTKAIHFDFYSSKTGALIDSWQLWAK